MNVIVRDKADYHQQTTERMDKHFVVPQWSAGRLGRSPPI